MVADLDDLWITYRYSRDMVAGDRPLVVSQRVGRSPADLPQRRVETTRIGKREAAHGFMVGTVPTLDRPETRVCAGPSGRLSVGGNGTHGGAQRRAASNIDL